MILLYEERRTIVRARWTDKAHDGRPPAEFDVGTLVQAYYSRSTGHLVVECGVWAADEAFDEQELVHWLAPKLPTVQRVPNRFDAMRWAVDDARAWNAEALSRRKEFPAKFLAPSPMVSPAAAARSKGRKRGKR